MSQRKYSTVSYVTTTNGNADSEVHVHTVDVYRLTTSFRCFYISVIGFHMMSRHCVAMA